jgi:uncharacterized protein YggE
MTHFKSGQFGVAAGGLGLLALGFSVLSLVGPAGGPVQPVRARHAPPGAGPGAGLGRHIKVDGTARLEVTPDRLDLSLVLEVQKPRPAAAAKALRRQQKALHYALRVAGVKADDLATTHVTLAPQYKRYPAQGIDHYAASVTFVTTLQDFSRLSDIMEAAAIAGVIRMHTRYWHSQIPALKRRLRETALSASRRKAAQIARSMGVATGQVLAVEETPESSFQGKPFWRTRVHNDFVNLRRSGDLHKLVRPDAIRLTLSVVATFAIR